jgi:hypothetical protein
VRCVKVMATLSAISHETPVGFDSGPLRRNDISSDGAST